MAQRRLTDFFPRGKRGAPGAQAAKRRKLQARPGPGPGPGPETDPDPCGAGPAERERLRALLAAPHTPPGSGPPPAPGSSRKRRRAEPEAAGGRGGAARKRLELPAGAVAEGSPKETLAELRGRLGKINTLVQKAQLPAGASETGGDLQKRLKQVRLLEAKIRERERSKEEKPGGVSQLPLVAKEPEPAAETREKAPAYQRFQALAQDSPPGLTLPYQYRVLAEMFRSMDTIVGVLFNRSEAATFSKVKQGVQDMIRKQFEERHLGQIKAVFPDSYTLRQEKNLPTFGGGLQRRSYQLTVEPVLGAGEKLSASRLMERRKTFSRNLVNIVKEHHKAFLAALRPPMEIPEHKLTRWHPRFNVDGVPDIVPAALPQPPQEDKITTAQEMLARAHGMLTPKMEKALTNLALRTALSSPPAPASPRTAPPDTPGSLRGVSQSLLERIRAKEAQKLQALMTRDPEQERRLDRLGRLPEMARVLRSVFVAEKKAALPLEVVGQRMVDSCRALMTPGEMEKHLRLFAELLPDWVRILPIRQETYVKLDRNTDLNLVTERLATRIREEERL